MSTSFNAGAAISDCRLYRYWLWRELESEAWLAGGEQRIALFVMLNPSTADATANDPTVRRCMGFAQRENCDRLEIVNLFALRATEPDKLELAADPIGPENDLHIQTALERAHLVVAGWGAAVDRAKLRSRCGPRVERVRAMLPASTRCLGTTSGGQPRHPLMVPREKTLEPYQ